MGLQDEDERWELMALEEIQKRRKDVKKEIKEWNIAFKEREGRWATRKEKREIAHKYKLFKEMQEAVEEREGEERRTTMKRKSSVDVLRTAREVIAMLEKAPVSDNEQEEGETNGNGKGWGASTISGDRNLMTKSADLGFASINRVNMMKERFAAIKRNIEASNDAGDDDELQEDLETGHFSSSKGGREDQRRASKWEKVKAMVESKKFSGGYRELRENKAVNILTKARRRSMQRFIDDTKGKTISFFKQDEPLPSSDIDSACESAASGLSSDHTDNGEELITMQNHHAAPFDDQIEVDIRELEEKLEHNENEDEISEVIDIFNKDAKKEVGC